MQKVYMAGIKLPSLFHISGKWFQTEAKKNILHIIVLHTTQCMFCLLKWETWHQWWDVEQKSYCIFQRSSSHWRLKWKCLMCFNVLCFELEIFAGFFNMYFSAAENLASYFVLLSEAYRWLLNRVSYICSFDIVMLSMSWAWAWI